MMRGRGCWSYTLPPFLPTVCFKGSFCQLQQYRFCSYPEPEKMRSLMDYGGRCFSGNGPSNCIHLAEHSSAGSLFLTPAVQDNLYPTHCYAAQSIPTDVPHYICVGSGVKKYIAV